MRTAFIQNASLGSTQIAANSTASANQAASNAAAVAPQAAQAVAASQSSKVLSSEKSVSTTQKESDPTFDSKNRTDEKGAALTAQEEDSKKLLAVA